LVDGYAIIAIFADVYTALLRRAQRHDALSPRYAAAIAYAPRAVYARRLLCPPLMLWRHVFHAISLFRHDAYTAFVAARCQMLLPRRQMLDYGRCR